MLIIYLFLLLILTHIAPNYALASCVHLFALHNTANGQQGGGGARTLTLTQIPRQISRAKSGGSLFLVLKATGNCGHWHGPAVCNEREFNNLKQQ